MKRASYCTVHHVYFLVPGFAYNHPSFANDLLKGMAAEQFEFCGEQSPSAQEWIGDSGIID